MNYVTQNHIDFPNMSCSDEEDEDELGPPTDLAASSNTCTDGNKSEV